MSEWQDDELVSESIFLSCDRDPPRLLCLLPSVHLLLFISFSTSPLLYLHSFLSIILSFSSSALCILIFFHFQFYPSAPNPFEVHASCNSQFQRSRYCSWIPFIASLHSFWVSFSLSCFDLWFSVSLSDSKSASAAVSCFSSPFAYYARRAWQAAAERETDQSLNECKLFHETQLHRSGTSLALLSCHFVLLSDCFSFVNKHN